MFAAICREEKTVIYVKVKESVYKPAQAQGLQEVEATRSWHMKVASLSV